jgi:uncharacterized Fe-S cluster protein YjdI
MYYVTQVGLRRGGKILFLSQRFCLCAGNCVKAAVCIFSSNSKYWLAKPNKAR